MTAPASCCPYVALKAIWWGTKRMRKTLSDTYIRSRKPARAKTPDQKSPRDETMDTEHPRLGLRVTATGHKSFFYLGRFPGSDHPKRRLIGDYPTTTLAEARVRARSWDTLLAKGIDPRVEVRRIKEAEERETRETALAEKNSFETRAREYLRTYCKDHRQAKGVARMIDVELMPHWRDRRIDDISSREIRELILAIAERSPSVARNTLTVAKSFFAWAEELEHVEESPAAAIRPQKLLGTKPIRQRLLNDDEIRKFWDATGKLGYPYQHLYRLIALTGTRLLEAAHAQWSEIDASTWTIPPERFKSDTYHTVPLSDAAMRLLDELPRFGPYLFTFDGKRPVNNFQIQKKRLDQFMRVDDFVIHDLRRVVRSKLASLKVPDTIAEMVLGHGKKGLQRVYDQHTYEAELRDALQEWANKLRDIIEPPPPNLVKLSEKKRKRRAVPMQKASA
jgi:intergrase/recombinase